MNFRAFRLQADLAGQFLDVPGMIERKNRSPVASFLLYWAVLSLGPLFIGLALAISTYLVSVKVFFDECNTTSVVWKLKKTRDRGAQGSLRCRVTSRESPA